MRCADGLTRFFVVAKLLLLSTRRANYPMNSILKCTILLTLSAIACGCGGGSRGVNKTISLPQAVRPVVRDATQEELLGRYNSYARSVKSVDAVVELKATSGTKYSGVIEEYHEVKAFLLAARPWNIRVIGQVPVVGKTVFDMASDAQTFEVYIPAKNQFLVGSVAVGRASNKPIENLRPQHLIEALLWSDVRKEEAVLFEEYNDDAARYYILTVLRGGYQSEILRKIWFDRSDLHIARLQGYGPKGLLLSDIRYSDWQPISPAPAAGASSASVPVQTTTSNNGASNAFPRTIRIDRPHDEYRLDLAVDKVSLNDAIDPTRFKLDPPQGAEIAHVDDAGEAKKP
jgi:outer membrane lipoprotein-sorting protein